MRFRDLALRLRALVRPRRVERDLHDELSFHIERETRRLLDAGVPHDQAHARARARFGSAAAVADACRDERGIGFFEKTSRDVRFAFRSFRRAPLVAATIVGTVAIGLGVVAILFTILNRFLFHVDAVPHIQEMYAVERTRVAAGEKAPFTRAAFDALRRETLAFGGVYAAVHDVDLRIDGRMMAASLVTGNFFDVVGVEPVMGRPITPGDDEAGGHRVIVLSDRGWTRQFNRDPGVLGWTVLVRDVPFEIVGVMPRGFRGLEVTAPDFWAPLPQIAAFLPGARGREPDVDVDVVGRLAAGVTADSARAQIDAWNRNRPRAALEAESIALRPRRGTVPDPLEAVALFIPLFFAFGLILMIGCANVANLLLARGVARQREIGIRLSLGASRPRLVRQLLTESLLLALAASAGGYAISRIGLEALVHWVVQAMPVDLGDSNIEFSVIAADWRVALFLIVAAVGATAFFALMPALQATRIEPARTLRRELVKEARPGRYRNALIAVQVFASALLLIGSAIFLRSALASSRFDPGFRTTDTVFVQLLNEPKRAAMVEAVASEPLVAAYAALRPGLLDWPFAAFATSGTSRIPLGYRLVSREYFDVLGIPILRGRTFTAAERTGGAPVAIVSESTARQLWPNGSGVGEVLRLEPDLTAPQPDAAPALPSRQVTIVGVSRDVRSFRITDIRQPGVFLPADAATEGTSLVARVNGDVDLARRALTDRLTTIDPSMGLVVTLRTIARLETLFLQIAFWVSLALGALALLLTVSGLFSVLSYLVEQRSREIGVRMALGATSRQVTRLVLAQTARPVAYGLIGGAGLAAALAVALRSVPAAAPIAEIVRVTDPVAYAASLLAIVAACLGAARGSRRTRRPARSDAHAQAGVIASGSIRIASPSWDRRGRRVPLALRTPPARRPRLLCPPPRT